MTGITKTQCKQYETSLELAQRLWNEHRPRDGNDAKYMVYDYMPEWLRDAIPPLYSQEEERDPVVWLKTFLPEGRWTFYATEYSQVAPDGMPDLFFGYLASPLGSDCDELCYMTLEQVRELRGAGLGSPVEVDLWWKPKRLSEVKAEIDGPDVPDDVDMPDALQDLNAQAATIKAHEGEPCTVIASVEDGQIVDVITPAWLYWQFGGTVADAENLSDHELNAARDKFARQMFKGDQGRDAEFRRYCRCVVQGMLLGQSHSACVATFRNDADFSPSPAWQNWLPFLGNARPAPEFEIEDDVHFNFLDEPDTERRSVDWREWREYNKAWYYKVSGKWYSESSFVAAGAEEEPKEIAFRAKERVWWESGDGVETGMVTYDARHGEKHVSVNYDKQLTVAGGVPIGRVTRVLAARLHKGDPPDTPVNVDLPEGWQVGDVRFLLEQLEKGKMVLVADRNLGIPTIHDFTGVRHCGMGVMMVEQPGFQAMFDAGASMERTPTSNKGWTSLAVREGSYDYPFGNVQQTLKAYCCQTWQYVPPRVRQGKLAAKFEGDASALREELGKNPNQKRVDYILSALTDAGWPVPPGYVVATEAGLPVEQVVKPYMDGQPTAPFEGEHVIHLKGTMRQRSWVGDVVRISGPIAPVKGVEATGGTWTAAYHTHDYGPMHFVCGGKIAVQAESAEECARRLEELLRGFGHQIQIVLSDHLPDDVCGEPAHTLSFGDNGSQVYFEGDQYMVLNPYIDQDGQRYGSGWVWYFRSEIETHGEWQLLSDPDIEGCYIGDLSLSEAVLYAQRVEQVVFDLASAPDDLPDRYPKPLYDKVQDAKAEESARKVEAKPKKRKLPDDIPEQIEVDLGRFNGWAVATAERVKGRWLHYRLSDGRNGKVQVIGRDMLWRVPAAAS